MHTNLDNSFQGVSRVLAEKLGLKNLHILQPLTSEPDLCGAGMVGEFEIAMEEIDFLSLVADAIGTPCLRHSALTGKKIQKVALCGGSGVPFMADAMRCGADAYLTADIKYHDFFVPEGNILLVDGGHFETEQFTKELLCKLIRKKFPTFAAEIAETKTNSVHYFVKNK
jgi:putative NIF3 family GTP cyclohydrolase 1 type 2